jgi:hypothetical protein
MSIAPLEFPNPDAPPPFPETTPRLPVVELRSADPRLNVHYSFITADEAARAEPDAAFYDVRGVPLELVSDGLETPGLQARAEADPDGVRRSVMGVVRAVIKASALDGPDAAEARAVADWLDVAPTLEHLIYGLALSPFDDDSKGRHCTACSAWRRLTHPAGCC